MKNKLRFNNTYKSGAVTFLIIKEKEKFVGVCLEFDLVTYADSMKEAKEIIEDYANAWLKNATKNKLPETLLNKPAPKKYWSIYERIKLEEEARKKQTSVVREFTKPVISCYQPYSPQYHFA